MPPILLVCLLACILTELTICFSPVHVIRKTSLNSREMTQAPITTVMHRRRPLQHQVQATPNPIDETLSSQRTTNFLVFLGTYLVVPFVTSATLLGLNDIYQSGKQRFNAAMASGFDPQLTAPDSAEYIAMSSLYNESMRYLFVLLLSKRLALYFIATVATVYAGWRSYEGVHAIKNGAFSGPGESLDRLNNEILDGEPYLAKDSSLHQEGTDSEDDDKKVFAAMIDQDEQSLSEAGKTLAFGLPVALTASLAASYCIVVAGKESIVSSAISEDNILSDAQSWLSSNFPYLTTLPSVILCILFLGAEFRRVFPSFGSSKEDSTPTKEPLLCPGNVLALLYVMGAYLAKSYPTISMGEVAAIPISLDLWPLQNGVNTALTATVTRALGPFLVSASSKSIRTTALALIGVTIFDGVSVFGTVANAAMDASSQSSVMEVVARSKLGSQSSNLAAPWQPGLLEIIVGHNSNQVTEALGLGDVVFPACLITWALNADTIGSVTADECDETSSNLSMYQYTAAATFGYIFASLLMEVVGSFSLLGNRGGLPALVFLIPSMLLCVSLTAWRRGELHEVWGD